MLPSIEPDAGQRRRLLAVARRQAPPDVVVTNGRLVDVLTETIHDGWDVAIAGRWIAAVEPGLGDLAGESTRVIDADGGLISPGLVECHTHLSRLNLSETIRLQVAAGVTTTILESNELCFVLGTAAFDHLLAEAAHLPGRVYLTVSPLVGLDPHHEERIEPAQDWASRLDRVGVLGVGEVYWADLLRGHDRAETLIGAAIARGLTVEGHGAGARWEVLNAMAVLGIAADHESISLEDAVARLRLGFYTLVRDGQTRQDLGTLAALWRDTTLPLDRVALVTDGVDPDELLAGNSLNAVVRRAAASGLSLATAIRMASLTPARRFGLDHLLGALRPGLVADLQVLPSADMPPQLVLVGGADPAPPVAVTYPDWMSAAVDIPPFDPSLLVHPGRGRWRAMSIVETSPLVTLELETDGEGCLVIVSIDRLGAGRAFKGLIQGLGLTGGAVALTSGADSNGIVALGDTPADIDLAIRSVIEMRGGTVVVALGRVTAQLPADIGGVVSSLPAEHVAERYRATTAALKSLGCWMPNPVITLEFLTSAGVPHLRICPSGYVRIRDGARLGLVWS